MNTGRLLNAGSCAGVRNTLVKHYSPVPTLRDLQFSKEINVVKKKPVNKNQTALLGLCTKYHTLPRRTRKVQRGSSLCTEN